MSSNEEKIEFTLELASKHESNIPKLSFLSSELESNIKQLGETEVIKESIPKAKGAFGKIKVISLTKGVKYVLRRISDTLINSISGQRIRIGTPRGWFFEGRVKREERDKIVDALLKALADKKELKQPQSFTMEFDPD
ncbi:hypothetical protein CEE45_03460 [Candidatus Heimdallarchaeota archaeon B3_Heim]|nr:MAG: hypothetical protein CEE45_03460 [Candidatus Heimdallarchaeota archaeon B3_Heim]